ncbi:MAG: polysaccharide biosynthesis C-terminal domain-containing protein, partial [Cyanobacteria bacterium REEB65]|nr:polysaccharide biosynthesis C-terminal domain-containing protein [Cyanobacteria bacterium REEB65]
PVIRDAGRLLWPSILSSSIGTVNVFIGAFFLSYAGKGALSAWGYANQIYQLPLGTLLAAMLVPLFPLLTSAAARGDRPALMRLLDRGMNLVLTLCVPLSVALAILATPMVRAAFDRGQFHATNGTAPTASVLAVLAFGLVGYAARDLLVRVFYAMNDSRTPLRVSLLSVLLNIGLNYTFMHFFHAGLRGIALSTALVTWANCLQIAWSLWKRLDGLELPTSRELAGRVIVATLAAGGITLLGEHALTWHSGARGGLVELAVLAVLGLGTYGAALAAFGVRLSGIVKRV